MSVHAPWSVPWLRQRCEEFRAELTSQGYATAEELAAYWPGGEENQETGRGKWIYCYAQLSGFLRAAADPAIAEADQDDVLRALREAAREEPVTVELVGPAGGPATTLQVYPKSLHTMTEVDDLGLQLQWLVQRLELLERAWSAEAMLRQGEALRLITQIELLLCWIATTPGPGLPYDSTAELPSPPTELREQLGPLDYLTILGAYHHIHRTRTGLVARRLRAPAGKGDLPDWVTLAGAAARAQRQDIERIWKHRSFGAWFSQFVLDCERLQEVAEATAPASAREPVLETL